MKKTLILENVMLVLLTVFVTWIVTAFIYQNSVANTKTNDLRDIINIISNTDYKKLDKEIDNISKSTNIHIELFANNDKSDNPNVIKAREIGYYENHQFYGLLNFGNVLIAQQLDDGRVITLSSKIDGSGVWSIFILVLSLLIAVVVSYKYSGKLIENIRFLLHGASITMERAENEGGLEVVPPPELLQYEEFIDSANSLAEVSTDVSKRIKELYVENKRVEYLLNNMREGLVLLHKDMSIVMVNKSAANFFDVDESVKGQNILHLTHTPIISESLEKVIETGEPLAIDFKIPGTKTILQILISAVLNEEQDINGSIMLISDVTETRLAEQIRSEFVANASHELKTPLTSIKGFSELIKSGIIKDPNKIDGYLEQITNETERMISVINDILQLSEIEATVKDTGQIQLSLKMIAQKVCTSLENQIKDKNVAVFVTGDIGSMVANSNHIQQIILNLVDNAIKYNKQGGKVEVNIKQTIKSVQLTVSDTGVGVPEESRQRIFERFYRVDKSRSRKAGGTGLGLSIVKHIVELYSGQIVCESVLGEGTKIIVTFPTEYEK